MGRRCECAGLLEAVRGDLRLRMIPAAARWLWLVLADQLTRFPQSRISSAAEVSLAVSVPETDGETRLETHLETLLKTGLLIRRADGTLGLPDAPASASRRGYGGRPRKNEERAEYLARQRSLRLLGVHDGGRAAAETQETQPETPWRARASAYLSESAEERSKQELPAPPGFAAIGEELAELARLDPVRGGYDFAVVKDWLSRGATAEMLREVVGRIAERPGYRIPDRAGLRYFGPAVAEALRAASVPAPDPELRRRNDLLAAWINGGQNGPCPVELRNAS